MPEDMNLSPSSSQNATLPEDPKKKGSGCSCFLIGCLIIIALVLIPIIGGSIYIITLDDLAWGSKIVGLIKHKRFSEGFKNGIKEADNLSNKQKQALIQFYDQFLTDYDSLSKENQEIIDRNIYIVIKKIIFEPEKFEEEPPKEFLEILSILNLGFNIEKMPELKKQLEKTLQQIKKTDNTDFDTP